MRGEDARTPSTLPTRTRARAEPAEVGVQMIAPDRRHRKRRTQDGRRVRRFKRRWKVERTSAWLPSFRRVRVRDEREAEHFLAFVQLACILILFCFAQFPDDFLGLATTARGPLPINTPKSVTLALWAMKSMSRPDGATPAQARSSAVRWSAPTIHPKRRGRPNRVAPAVV